MPKKSKRAKHAKRALNADTPTPELQTDATPEAASQEAAPQNTAAQQTTPAAATNAAAAAQEAAPQPAPAAANAAATLPEAPPPLPTPAKTPATAKSDAAQQAAQAAQVDPDTIAKLLANAPTLEQLEKELKRERRRVDFGRVLRNTLFSLIVVASVSALIAVLFLPVLQIHGTSMTPTFQEQDVVAALSFGKFNPGDLIAFYYNNNILVKRVIAGPGDWVDIDEDGNVSVNGQPLNEPYLTEKALGNCDITLPYQVPDARYFVMGDHRATSVDSRTELVGCVSREMVIGRIILRVWPLETIRLF